MTTEVSNGYSVRLRRDDGGWEVHILDATGSVAGKRHCSDETEARTYASTVQQHMFWLSPAKFREYYRLEEIA